MAQGSDSDELRRNILFQNMLAALKEEVYATATSFAGVQSNAEHLNFRTGVLTGLTRALELLQAEENLTAGPSESSEESED